MTTLLGSDWLTGVCLVAATTIIFAYLRIKYIYSKFAKRGVPYVKPIFLTGSDPGFLLGNSSVGTAFWKCYNQLKGEKIGGCFVGLTPHWLIRDPAYVNKVFTTYFDAFPDRGFLVDEKVNPIEDHIFLNKGNKWRYLRYKLSPVFTSGKLKYMYGQLYKCSELLLSCIDQLAKDGGDVDLKDTFARYSTDIIASTAFGLEPDSLTNQDSKFREMGARFFETTLFNSLRFALRFAFPRFVIFIKMRTTAKDISDYFLGVIRQAVQFRRNTKSTRNDFLQLAMEIQEKGKVELDAGDLEENEENEKAEKIVEQFEFTDDLLAAQSFVFFLAGFETTSTTFHFATYLLAHHPDVQEKMRTEVREVKKKHGTFTYDSLKDLTYMDMVIDETLRLFPAVPWIIRECRQSTAMPDGTLIEKGDKVAMSVIGLQRDPDYFPEPDLFKPERFRETPLKGTYIPFGDGPRICIGKRFAQMELKMTLALLLDSYAIEKSPQDKKTDTTVEFSNSITLSPNHPFWIRIKKLTT